MRAYQVTTPWCHKHHIVNTNTEELRRILCDPFYHFIWRRVVRGSGDYIRSWNSGSKFTQTVVIWRAEL